MMEMEIANRDRGRNRGRDRGRDRVREQGERLESCLGSFLNAGVVTLACSLLN